MDVLPLLVLMVYLPICLGLVMPRPLVEPRIGPSAESGAA